MPTACIDRPILGRAFASFVGLHHVGLARADRNGAVAIESANRATRATGVTTKFACRAESERVVPLQQCVQGADAVRCGITGSTLVDLGTKWIGGKGSLLETFVSTPHPKAGYNCPANFSEFEPHPNGSFAQF